MSALLFTVLSALMSAFPSSSIFDSSKSPSSTAIIRHVSPSCTIRTGTCQIQIPRNNAKNWIRIPHLVFESTSKTMSLATPQGRHGVQSLESFEPGILGFDDCILSTMLHSYSSSSSVKIGRVLSVFIAPRTKVLIPASKLSICLKYMGLITGQFLSIILPHGLLLTTGPSNICTL